MILTSVLLPAPFSPRSAWISPGATAKATSELAITPGNRLVIPRSSRRSGVALPSVMSGGPFLRGRCRGGANSCECDQQLGRGQGGDHRRALVAQGAAADRAGHGGNLFRGEAQL